jgi:L-ascorbate metabolism protein UlaG (beta-lactamase superfamily)
VEFDEMAVKELKVESGETKTIPCVVSPDNDRIPQCVFGGYRVLRYAILVGLVMLAPLSTRAFGQEPKSESKEETIKIRWYGQSFFQIETSKRFKIVFDPHAIPFFERPLVKADYVLISHLHNDHNQVEILEPQPKESDVYRGLVEPKPGKQEWKLINEKRGQITFRNIGTFHDALNGMQRGKNSIWIVEADGLVFCHLGDLGHELTPEQVRAIGKVDVLMVPVGGIYTINGEQAKKVVEQIKPRLYILPMHYGVPGYDDLVGPDEFLEGQKNVKKMTGTNELIFPVDMKLESPTIVLLGWKKELLKKEEKK